MKRWYLLTSVAISTLAGALMYGACEMAFRRDHERRDRSTKTVVERSDGRIEMIVDDMGPRITITDKKGKIVDITVDGILVTNKEGKKVYPFTTETP